MLLRWLHKIWSFFLSALLILVITGTVTCLLTIGVLQLPQSKQYFANQITGLFNKQYQGTIQIERISGIIPINISLHNVEIYSPSDMEDAVVSIPQSSLSLDIWELLQRKITITGFELQQPDLNLVRDSTGYLTLARTFQPIVDGPDTLQAEGLLNFEQFQIFAPELQIIDGRVTIDPYLLERDFGFLPNPLVAENLDLSVMLELGGEQRFLEIDQFSANLPNTIWENIRIHGQVFNDSQFLEFNGFTIETGSSHLEFSGEITPMDLSVPSPMEQFMNASYHFQMVNSAIHSNNIALFYPEFEDLDEVIELETIVEGTSDSLWVDRFWVRSGESSLMATGLLQQLGQVDFHYEADLQNLVLDQQHLQTILGNSLTQDQVDYFAETRLSGSASGNRERIDTNLQLHTSTGMLTFDASSSFQAPFNYQAALEISSVDTSPFLKMATPKFEQSNLTGRIDINGTGLGYSDFTFNVTGELDSLIINHINAIRGNIDIQYANDLVQYNMMLQHMESALESSGRFQLTDDHMIASLQGNLANIDLSHLLQREQIPETNLTLSFNTEFQGTHIDSLFGRISFQTEESIVGADTLRPHQLYADLDAPDNPERNFRMTSSFLDLDLTGDINPTSLIHLYNHWGKYLEERIAEEILFDTTGTTNFITSASTNELLPANLQIRVEIKDAELLQNYFVDSPVFGSFAVLNTNINASADRLLLTATASDQSNYLGNLSSQGANANLTASFRYNETLKEYGTIDLQLNSDQFSYRDVTIHNAWVNASMRSDSLMVRHASSNEDGNVNLNLTFLTKLFPGRIEMNFAEFSLGSDQYDWITSGQPTLTYSNDKTLNIADLEFVNGEEVVAINGTYSPAFEDSVEYRMQNFQLSRVSDLIGGRVSFSGVMNGNFLTRSLTQIPVIQGDMRVNRMTINDRLIGDMQLTSIYSPDEERFNTNISILTDPVRYQGYLSENDDIGQNIVFNGYFRTPDLSEPENEIFYFDAEMEEIDMWIVSVIVPKIVEEMEGSASGTGFISGTLNSYDFNAEFDISDVFARPRVLNTEYLLNGNLVFDRNEGLIFDDIEITDDQGGDGLLTGRIDLNDFSGTNFMDLTMKLNDLQFFNNSYDPDIPFYADARGTGEARITGTNLNPFLRTTIPITISPNSSVSIPLLNETDLDASQKFIQFVDSFDLNTQQDESGDSNGTQNGSSVQNDPRNLSFSERFRLDLQFDAPDAITFELIFDRVTNEILTTNGEGQIRLTLEDQNFSMFGRMNIVGGDYQFVAGDIISRRFQIQDGGSIIWEGDPGNARLNVLATYRARPDLSSLLATTTGSGIEPGQRFSIDLALNIGGTINNLENDFYFNIPSNIEGTIDPTLSAQINTLNRNEEEKVLQATSVLLTGNFIPPSTFNAEGDPGGNFRENLPGGGSVFVNPLISNQVINPLLSEQINSLLRNDIALDIDFNLTPYNQIDLGVALRLYNDRLILRRDGQITGEQSDIGDLGATYRISRTFAVTAFHRQDPTLANTSGSETRQTQEMNGIGLEAQVQFNSWKEFRHRIRDTFRRLFGIKEPEEDLDDDATIAVEN